MAITDIFKTKQFKSEIERLKTENSDLNKLLTPEMKDVSNLQQYIRTLEERKEQLENDISDIQNNIRTKKTEVANLEQSISTKRKCLLTLDDDILVQDFGLYQPKFDFMNSDLYKERLKIIRDKQKEAIKNGSAATGNMGWTVNGSNEKGKKMVKDMQKLLLRAFNSECDELIAKVKYNNFESCLKRMTASKNAISKLGIIMNISITNLYYNLKVDELHLALEYQIKKQEEKEEAKEARAKLREEAKLQKEIEEQRRKIEKEQTHYQRALSTILEQLSSANNDTEKNMLSQKKKELEEKLTDINKSLSDIDYREANQRAGYVYVISNIGSFGENIYKIGMTRRLEPMDRIDELGSASVPFNFDVHAMIFSDDAPALEAALHRAFENKKLNMVNTRREFFNVTLEEIEQVVKANYDKTVEFTKFPNADQFRISQAMKNENTQTRIVDRNITDVHLVSQTNNHEAKVSSKHITTYEDDNNFSNNYIHTKWGKIPKPDPYKVDFTRGPR